MRGLAGWIGDDAISPIIGEHDPYYHVSARVRSYIDQSLHTVTHKNVLYIHYTLYLRIGFIQEQHHIRAAAFLMTCVMIVAVLSSIAIVRRILMATSVLKVSTYIS